MGVRIAEIDGDGIPTMLTKDGAEAAVDLRHRLVPADGDEAPVAAHERLAQAIGIGVELLQRVRFRADVAGAEDVVAIAADVFDLASAHRDGEPAGGFTERAGDVALRGRHGDSPCPWA